MDPRPLTLRELLWLLEGRERSLWNHTSALLAEIVNLWRKDRLPPARFNPFECGDQASGEPTAEEARQGWSDLKSACLGGGFG